MSFNHFEYKDSLFIAALSPSFAYGIGQGTRRNKRAYHPDADPEDWVQRGASHLLAKSPLRPKDNLQTDQSGEAAAAKIA